MAKSDSDQIQDYIESLSKALGLKDGKEFWPAYLFHVTDVANAILILQIGSLLSRHDAQRSGVLTTDSANQEIIGGTDSLYTDRVRLYFRPRTPTHYKTEGFRPKTDRLHDTHYMPMPVAFIFDSAYILTQDGVLFTDGNAGSGQHRTGSDVQFLKTIPFQFVYSDVSDGPTQHDIKDLTFHRNAEVCVASPMRLLPSLRGVRTRSEAELDTLLYQVSAISPDVAHHYSPLIKQNSQPAGYRDLFYRRWLHVNRIRVIGDRLLVTFVPTLQGNPAFDVRLTVKSAATGEVFGIYAGVGSERDWAVQLPSQCQHDYFVVHISIDDDLAYENSFPSLETKLLVG